jgi:hypothetical protein
MTTPILFLWLILLLDLASTQPGSAATSSYSSSSLPDLTGRWSQVISWGSGMPGIYELTALDSNQQDDDASLMARGNSHGDGDGSGIGNGNGLRESIVPRSDALRSFNVRSLMPLVNMFTRGILTVYTEVGSLRSMADCIESVLSYSFLFFIFALLIVLCVLIWCCFRIQVF